MIKRHGFGGGNFIEVEDGSFDLLYFGYQNGRSEFSI